MFTSSWDQPLQLNKVLNTYVVCHLWILRTSAKKGNYVNINNEIESRQYQNYSTASLRTFQQQILPKTWDLPGNPSEHSQLRGAIAVQTKSATALLATRPELGIVDVSDVRARISCAKIKPQIM